MEDPDPLRDTGRATDEALLDTLRRMGNGGRIRAGLRFSGSMIAELTKGLIRMEPTSGMYTRPARSGATTWIR